MLKIVAPLALLSSLAACSTSASSEVPLVSLNNGASTLQVLVADNFTDPNMFELLISKFGDNPAQNAAHATDCVRFRDATTLTVNGVAGTMVEPGSFDDGDGGFETNCIYPQFQVELTSRPATLAFVLDDGTGQLEIDLAVDPEGHYQTTRCDAASCTP